MSRRIAVIGTTGAGKSTVARRLADLRSLPYVELDALHWGPRWTEASADEFRARALAATDGDSWVVDGNYSGKLGDLVLARADLVVWLDLPLPLILWQLLHRTAERLIRRTELWNGNRETFRSAFLTRPTLLEWAIKTHGARRRRLPARFAGEELAHLEVVRLRSRSQVERWLRAQAVE